jgi:nucleotide-binding universal stress UspA family protein
MYRSILVPLDGSPLGEWALPVAIHSARRAGAILELITIEVTIPTIGGAGLSTADTHTGAATGNPAETYLAEVAQRIAAVYPGPIKQMVTSGIGRPADIVLEYARHNADLIVMATHGYGPLKRFWLGSFADTVARRSQLPTLLIRPRSETRAEFKDEPHFKRVLVPLDGSEAALSIIDHAIAVADEGAELTLFHALSSVLAFGPDYALMPLPSDGAVLAARQEEAQKIIEQVADTLRARKINVRTEVVLEPFAAGAILDYAHTNQADLIALTTHGRGGAARLLLGSVADKVMRGADVPVLFFRPPAD